MSADLVKAHFNEGLYDVEIVNSKGNVLLESSKGILASGEKVDFNIKKEDIKIYGKDSILISNQIEMNGVDLNSTSNQIKAFILI